MIVYLWFRGVVSAWDRVPQREIPLRWLPLGISSCTCIIQQRKAHFTTSLCYLNAQHSCHCLRSCVWRLQPLVIWMDIFVDVHLRQVIIDAYTTRLFLMLILVPVLRTAILLRRHRWNPPAAHATVLVGGDFIHKKKFKKKPFESVTSVYYIFTIHSNKAP